MGYQQQIGMLLLIIFIMYKSYGLSQWISKERDVYKKKKVKGTNELIDRGNCKLQNKYEHTYKPNNIYKGSQDTNLYFMMNNFIDIFIVCLLLIITFA